MEHHGSEDGDVMRRRDCVLFRGKSGNEYATHGPEELVLAASFSALGHGSWEFLILETGRNAELISVKAESAGLQLGHKTPGVGSTTDSASLPCRCICLYWQWLLVFMDLVGI